MPEGDLRPTLVVLSETDPVAQQLAALWGSLPSVAPSTSGAPVRAVSEGLWAWKRPGPHIHDEHLERLLPTAIRAQSPTLVFASVHRSESGTRCLTVHPLGNPGPAAPLGGRPHTVGLTDPRRATGLLRSLDEHATALGLSATLEATHHGPEVDLPALFAEVAVLPGAAPTPEEVRALKAALETIEVDPADRIALGLGGGHYAPRFTDLAKRRRWAFGHILSRHALDHLDPLTARSAWEASPGAEGVILARAQDRPALQRLGLGPELSESGAERRRGSGGGATSTTPRTSGT